MRGSIRSRGGNSWQIQIYTGKDPTGKPMRYMETVRGKKADAQKRLNELLVSMDKGLFTPVGKMTVGEHLEAWLDGIVKTKYSRRTHEGYASIIKRHLAPAFGSLPLKQLTPISIQGYYGKAGETLSANSVHHHHQVLSESLKYAVRQGYLGNNPCDLVDPPTVRRIQMRTLTPDEVITLLDVGKDSYYYPVIYTALNTGLRQAELLGLRWRDVAPDILSISVNQVLYKRGGICQFLEPKTAHSRRRVAMTPKLASFLKQYKAQREVLYLETGKILSPDSLVFTSYRLEPLNPSVLGHNFHKITVKAGLKNVRFHDLRHSFASLMLMRGAKPKVISEALGHASVGFTMTVYSHIIAGMQEEAMMLLDGVIPEGHIQSFNVNLTSTIDSLSVMPR